MSEENCEACAKEAQIETPAVGNYPVEINGRTIHMYLCRGCAAAEGFDD